jgi:hypothetical protein
MNADLSQKSPAFAANKKWAVSPLISPPAGAVTATQADKFVCIVIIRRNAGKFNVQMEKQESGVKAGCGL